MLIVRLPALLIVLCLAAAAPAADALLPGDATGDGVVGVDDLGVLATNYDQSGLGWQQGDFTGDGIVNVDDLGVLATSYESLLFDVTVQLTNNTGATKSNWPVFLAVWKVFGGNLPLEKLRPGGFHVYDGTGAEAPYMLRAVPPDFSIGNDEIVFIVPSLASGASATYRITNSLLPGLQQNIDLAGNANNLLPNPSFEANSSGTPTGWTLMSGSSSRISYDTTNKKAGNQSLLLSLPAGNYLQLRTASTISFTTNRGYYFAVWGKTQNTAYTGYGFSYGVGAPSPVSGCRVYFSNTAFTGRDSLLLRDTRDWHSYRFDSGANDAGGVPPTASQGRRTAALSLYIDFNQPSQNFLSGDKSGKVWFDEMLLMEQPTVTINRQARLGLLAAPNAFVFARPVDMPLAAKPALHEAVASLEAYAFAGERRQLRLGIHALADLANVGLTASALTGPSGQQLPLANIEIEKLGDYVDPYAVLLALANGSRQEYLLAYDVQPGQAAGVYTGTVSFTVTGQTLKSLPVRLEVLAQPMPTMSNYWVGGIYNQGYPLARDDDFYACYGKLRFNYMMLFDQFTTSVADNNINFAAAQTQVDKLRALARVDNGIGLYREPNMADDQPRKWYQIAEGIVAWPGKYATVPTYDNAYKAGYQDLAQQHEEYAIAHNWPTQIYMVGDEPDDARDVNAAMGWLNERLPNAITVNDVQYKDMIATWAWYNMVSIDDPCDWSGPLMYSYIRANKGRFGFCGQGDPAAFLSGRYEHGLLLATTGACYLHWWHVQKCMREVGSDTSRAHFLAAAANGMTDLRYYAALKDAMAAAAGAPLAVEAQNYLNGVFAYANGDNDRHLLPYNGTPFDWGDDRWYDKWQATMKGYLAGLNPGGGLSSPPAQPQPATLNSSSGNPTTPASIKPSFGVRPRPRR